MKKFSCVFIVFLSISFFLSCSEDNSGEQPQVIDSIELTLTTSKAAYQNASQGDWISITKTEFDDLTNNLEQISKIGIEESLYPSDANSLSGISNNSGSTFSNATTATIPSGSYVFAVRFYVGTGIFAQSKDNNIKITDTGITKGYYNLGNPVPEANTDTSGEVFYVLKGNTTATKNTGYLAINMRGPNGLRIIQDDAYSAYRGPDDANDLPFEAKGLQVVFQGLSTTQIQWE